MSRYFHGLIFFGSNCTEELVLLQDRLNKAISIASGRQQLPQGSSEAELIEEYEFKIKMKKELEDGIRDIAVALTGRNITFGEEVSYPPNPSNGTKL